VIGRQSERQQARNLLEQAAQHRGGWMSFVGAAGIGKSTLLDEIANDASQRGFALRRVNGTPSEQALPFAALNALLSRDLSDVNLDPVLAASIGLAPTEVPPLPQAVAAALVGHLSEKAETQPLLVIIDDLQWIDASSINVLGLLATSIGADRFALIFGVRTGAGRAEETSTNEPWNPAHITSAAEVSPIEAPLDWIDQANPVVLQPLSDEDSLALLLETGISISEARAITDIAGGLPLALVELARNGSDGSENSTRFVDMARLYARRLEQLPKNVRRIAELAAIESNLEAVRTIYGKGFATTLAAAQHHEILRPASLGLDNPADPGIASPEFLHHDTSDTSETTSTDDEAAPHAPAFLEFAHPLLRVAALGATSASEQRTLHRQFADILTTLDRHQPKTGHQTEQPQQHLDRVALHRGAAALGADDEAADLLVAFAGRAKGQGALVEASQALLRAAELTTEPQLRTRRMLDGAADLYTSGDPRRAIVIIDREIPRIHDPNLLGDAEFLYARVAEWEQPSTNTVAILRRLARRFEESEPIRSSWALGMAASMAMMAGDLRTGIDDARRSLELAEANNEFFAAIVAKGNLVWNLFLRGERGEAEEAVGSIAGLMKMASETETVEGIMVAQGIAMMSVVNEEWTEADVILTNALGLARKMGIRLSTVLLSTIRGNLMWRLGRWDEGALLVNQDLSPQGLPAISYTWGSAESASMAASRGDEATVNRIMAQSLPEAERLGLPLVEAWLRNARAHLAMSKGLYAEAVADLDIVRSLTERMGLVEPGFFLWQGDWLAALIAVGRIDEARKGLARAKIVAASTGRRWLKGVIARTEGELALHDYFAGQKNGSNGDLSNGSNGSTGSNGVQVAVSLFDEALAWFTELGMPFEIARTHLTRARLIDHHQNLNVNLNVNVNVNPEAKQEAKQTSGVHQSSDLMTTVLTTVQVQIDPAFADGELTVLHLDELLFRDLDRAKTAFAHLGAIRWDEQTTNLRTRATERLRLGPTAVPVSEVKIAPRLAEQLTTAELRVAVCVAEGRTNREAAQELHVSSKTVEYHLQAVYRKLGVTNRSACTAMVVKARAMELSFAT
jgi:DNA-binding CsgD family transcriptional regulator